MRMLTFDLNRHGKPSLYHQIAEQIKTQIGNGRLPANTRLPTVRQLADQLGVTRLTVQNAYAELQADGWVEAVVGRGTFVSRSVQPHAILDKIGRRLTADGVLDDILQLDHVVGVRSMALAHPDDAFFPIDEFWAGLNRVRGDAESVMSYTSIQGDPQLRVVLADMVREEGITAVPEQIMIISGAMQGIALIAQAHTRPGDTVLIDAPTFLGTLNILHAQNLTLINVPLDGEGPCLDTLERLIQRHRPRFYYAIPNYHNPTGICMSLARREGLLQLAQRYQLPIIEDDIYGKLYYDAPPPPLLKALDPGDHVIYLSSFSKILMPGLRTGYLITHNDALRSRLLELRRATDLGGPGLVQRATAVFLQSGGLKRHLRKIRPIYKQRRDVLLEAMQTHLPHGVSWTRPSGGFSAWLTLPRVFAPGELYRTALQRGFAFTPGDAYLPHSDENDHFRLCFGNQSPTAIRAGVKVLGQIIREKM
ncbi:MAG: PLP-dependent aminotransferase family protein [Ardenticatenaceae bacterium]|nr:PLP-dependent aminotransferase family protein [Ardenticatenaceae bacterium]